MTARGQPSSALWPKALGFGVFLLVLWAQSDALVGVFYDDGVYVTAAKALAEGRGYRNIHLPGEPPVLHYPPLYPLALSLLWALFPSFPQNVALFQLLDAAAAGGAAWVMALHARRLGLPPWLQYPALALGFAAFPLLATLSVRFSEPLFLILFAAVVLAVDRDEPCTLRCGIVVGALAGAAALTRSVGVTLIVGVAAALWLRRQRRSAGVVVAAAALMLTPWIAWLLAHQAALDPRLTANYGTYLQEARQAGLAAMLAGLDLRALGPLAQLALPAVPALVWYPSALLLLALLVWGGVVAARRTPALVASLVLYVLVVSVWPYPPHRFMWLVVPWAALLFAAGCLAAWRWGRIGRAAVALAGLLFLTGYARREAASLAGRRFAATAEGISGPFRLLTASIAAETPPDAIIASEDEALIFLYTGRQAVPSHLFRWSGRSSAGLPDHESVGFFCDAGVTHLALTGPRAEAGRLVEALASRSDSILAPLFRITDGPALYRFRCPG